MNVKLAKSAGFCFGVKRAVDTVNSEIAKATNKKIYTYGPIIHNEEVVNEFKAQGVDVIEGVHQKMRVDLILQVFQLLFQILTLQRYQSLAVLPVTEIILQPQIHAKHH